MNGYLIEFNESFSLWNTLFNKHRIKIFHIRQADKFIDSGIIPNIPFQFGIGIPPLFCRHSKHCHIQHICFIGVNDINLFYSYFCGYKILFNGVSMYTIIDL